jgi:hypothetical protein
MLSGASLGSPTTDYWKSTESLAPLLSKEFMFNSSVWAVCSIRLHSSSTSIIGLIGRLSCAALKRLSSTFEVLLSS